MSGHEDSYYDYTDTDSELSYSSGYSSSSGSGSWWSGLWGNTVQRNQSGSSYTSDTYSWSDAEYQRRLQPLEDRQQRFESSMRNLESNVGQLEQDMLQRDRATQQRLQAQRSEFTQRLRQQQENTRRLIEAQDQRLTQLVREEQRQRQRAVADLQQQLNRIAADAARRQTVAASFVADITQIMTDVETLPHERFAPGEMENVRRHVRDAQSNLNADIPEAALSTAQNAYWQLVDLRSLVLQKEAEFMMFHQAALEKARAILEEARASRQCDIVFDDAADTEPLKLEVDFWTHGALTTLERGIQAREKTLVDGAESLSIDTVKDMLVALENEQAQVGAIVAAARDNIMAAQIRENLAQQVVSALQHQGYDFESAVYEGNDQRSAYVAKVVNRAGSEVVTVISPVAESCTRNRISIHSYDETFVDAGTLRQRAQDVIRLLAEEGLDVAPPTCQGDANQAYRDLNQVAARPPAVRLHTFQTPTTQFRGA